MKEDVGYLLKIITEKLKARADYTHKKYDLTFVQSKTISFLLDKANIASQKEIENFLKVAHSTVAGIISRMKQKGFVVTDIDNLDRRNKLVKLTNKAILIGNAIKKDIISVENDILKGFTKEQKTNFINVLKVIYQNLS